MRSTLIFTSLALSALATPVPVAQGQAPAPIENTLEARYIRHGNGEWTGTHSYLQTREVDVEDDLELEARRVRRPSKRGVRGPGKREESDDVELEARRVRGPSKRGVRGPGKREENDEVELEARRVRGPSKREESDDVDLEARRVRGPSKREENDEVELEARRVRGPSKREEDNSENKTKTARGVFGVSGILEMLKTREWNSANTLPARVAL